MSALPDPATPLYHHPLPALERWLQELGAAQRRGNPCLWDLHHHDWSAEVELDVEDLAVRWQQAGVRKARQFPYGLSRADVEAAILAGP
ncbi:MAG: DUF3143 domain-containing protein [Cyanobacteriota bacterium]|nr:DUF3143 domain-containing protein [Cyanobacteriota bacterium]